MIKLYEMTNYHWDLSEYLQGQSTSEILIQEKHNMQRELPTATDFLIPGRLL